MSVARELSENQLVQVIEDTFWEEFAACWERFQAEPTIADPESEMEELLEWFNEQVKAMTTNIMEPEPVEASPAVPRKERGPEESWCSFTQRPSDLICGGSQSGVVGCQQMNLIYRNEALAPTGRGFLWFVSLVLFFCQSA